MLFLLLPLKAFWPKRAESSEVENLSATPARSGKIRGGRLRGKRGKRANSPEGAPPIKTQEKPGVVGCAESAESALIRLG
jgi:hypothetical protein